MTVPASRIRLENDRPANPAGDFVLYWMVAARRTRYNFALQRAVELSEQYRRPLIILEALRLDYPHASVRIHEFVVEGMRANAAAIRASGALYYPYIEPSAQAGAGLLAALAARAVAVITDWYPAFFLPRMIAAAAAACPVAVEAIDGNGFIPVAEHGRAFPTARGYRAFMQRTLREHLVNVPDERPLDGLRRRRKADIADVQRRWPAADLEDKVIQSLPLDRSIGRGRFAGGERAAAATLEAFVAGGLARYGDAHNDPDDDATSHLSPYLHFGHISVHDVFASVMSASKWTTRRITKVRAGARDGWWGLPPGTENFLDQITVWRELAFNGCAFTPGYERYDTLPAWARATLEAHLSDQRPHLYSVEQLDAAETHDPLWNAAQRQLREEGWFHGYMRMLWGKKILEWCRHPAEALERMELLMNRYSLDGRDPVSYLNFGWVLGRYDRPWPERPVFGTVRTMTSESARKKLKVKAYLARYGDSGSEQKW